MLKKSCLFLGVLCSLFLLPVMAQGAIVNFNFPIDGPQANAGLGTGSLGLGTGNVVFDTGTNTLSWTITFAGMMGPATMAHFHGPALPTQNAGAQIGIGNVSPVIGNAVISAAQATDLLNELWYVIIHTSAFPGGEIRGQVVPEPVTLTLLGLGSVMLVRRRQRRNH
jgi:hypothetical protein